MTAPTCIRCRRPMADGAYACTTCGITKPAEQLRATADMTPAARDIAHGLSRRGAGAATGKPGSRLPLDLMATQKLDVVQGELGTLARQVSEERGRPFGDIRGIDPIVAAANWLPHNLEWLRHHRAVDEALATIEACARIVAGIARGPSEQKFLGPCGAVRSCEGLVDGDWPEADCGNHVVHEPHDQVCDGDVYAREGAQHGRCRLCGAEWSTAERRAWLDAEVRSHAYTATEIADAYPIKANTIRQWLSRGLLVPHGEIDGRPLLNLGQVLDLAAGDAARREEARATRARRAAARAAESEDAA